MQIKKKQNNLNPVKKISIGVILVCTLLFFMTLKIPSNTSIFSFIPTPIPTDTPEITTKKEKYHQAMLPFILPNFKLVESSYYSGFGFEGVSEKYSIKRSKEEVFAELVTNFRNKGYRVERSDQLEGDPKNDFSKLSAEKGHEPEIHIAQVLTESTDEVTVLKVSITNLHWYNTAITPPNFPCMGICPTQNPLKPDAKLYTNVKNCPVHDTASESCLPINIPSKILLTIKGQGNYTSQKFAVDRDWDIYWDYNCPTGANHTFSIRVQRPVYYTAEVITIAKSHAKGIRPMFGGYSSGEHSLIINTNTQCTWSIQVKN